MGESILAKGTRVQITPYTSKYAFHYLAALDGESGTVERLQYHGADMHVFVKMDNAIPFPLHALKEIEE